MHECRFLRDRIVHNKSEFAALTSGSSASRSLLLVAILAALSFHCSAQTITWSSRSNAINATSSRSSGMSGFRFELGVFATGFVPARDNIDQWAENWHPAQATFYNPDTKRFAGKFTVTHNIEPFISGADAYVWGFQGSPQEAEWILFRKSTWTWPQASSTPSPVSNNKLSWVAEQADVVFLGDIQQSGRPYLMQTASVSDTRPPNTPWHVWLQQQLAGVTAGNSPNEDADNDGISNLLEFVMGTNPKQSGGTHGTPVQIVPENSNKYLQISIPRRIDHNANLTVQVADHPAGPWLSGPEYTTVISNGIDSLIVRDRTPINSEVPRRFMRLYVDLPTGQ